MSDETLSIIGKLGLRDLESEISSLIGNIQENAASIRKILKVIHDRKLYVKDYQTWENYVTVKWGWTRQRGYQLIQAAAVVESLPDDVSTIVDSGGEGPIRELTKLPEEKRNRVVREIVKSGEPVTAAAIKDKAAKIVDAEIIDVSRNREPKEAVEKRDEVGYRIPAKVQELWDRGKTDIAAIMLDIQRIKRILTACEKEKDPLFVRSNFTVIQSDLHRVWSDIKMALPYAICPTCNGQVSRSCSFCEGNGFIGEFLWKTAVTKEDKEIRSKLANK